MFFSRSPIPFVQKVEQKNWLDHAQFYRHVGLYAYRNDILKKITQLPCFPTGKSRVAGAVALD